MSEILRTANFYGSFKKESDELQCTVTIDVSFEHDISMNFISGDYSTIIGNLHCIW